MAITTYLPIMMLNVNELNPPIKRHRMAKWILKKNKKPKTCLYAAYKKLTSDLKTHRLKVGGWKKVFHANRNFKKQYFLEYVSLGKGNKSKNKQMRLHQTKKLLHSEGNYQQNEKAAY